MYSFLMLKVLSGVEGAKATTINPRASKSPSPLPGNLISIVCKSLQSLVTIVHPSPTALHYQPLDKTFIMIHLTPSARTAPVDITLIKILSWHLPTYSQAAYHVSVCESGLREVGHVTMVCLEEGCAGLLFDFVSGQTSCLS